MNKIILLLTSIVLCTMIFCSCESTGIHEAASEKLMLEEMKSNSLMQVDEYELPMPSGAVLWDCSAYGDTIYYIVTYYGRTGQNTNYDITAHDIVEGKQKIIYTYKGDEVANVNEIRAAQDYLYWVVTTDSEHRLMRFDLLQNRLEEVYASPEDTYDQPIVLGGNTEYLSWYEPENGTDDSDNCWQVIYSLNGDSIQRLESQVFMPGTYARASINSDEQALVMIKKEKEFSFTLIDMETDKSIQLFDVKDDSNNLILCPQIGNDYIIWHDGYGYKNIYVYSINGDEEFIIDCDELGIDIFSVTVYENDILLNGGDAIYYIGIDDGMIYNITNSFDITYSYKLSKMTLDNQFLSVITTEDADNKVLKVKFK